MFVDVNGTKLYFDVKGAGLVPDGPRVCAKPSAFAVIREFILDGA